MSVYVWPTRLFPAPDFPTPEIAARTASGGISAAGLRQTVRTDGGGLWRVRFSGICLKTDQMLAAWDAWHGLLDGGATPVIVPKSMGKRAPALNGVIVPEQYVTSPFPAAVSDYTPSGPIAAVLQGAAALRATQITIRMTKGRNLIGGEHFAIEGSTWGWRRYKVAEVVSVTPGSGYVDHVVNIRTPLREALADQTAIDFNGPACVMQVEKMELPQNLRYGQVSISFVETFGV